MIRNRPPGWNDARSPLQDPAAEADRTAAYWAWIDDAEVQGATPPVATASNGGHWAQLLSADDADFEAAHMRHSIGHSWAKYSTMGEIYSLRSPQGIPEATVLVAGGVVIHAREHRNARLSSENMRALEDFATESGWAIKPDTLPFDVLQDEQAPNTKFVYLLRGGGNAKLFSEAVVAGHLTDRQIASMAEAMGAENRFVPSDIGLPGLDGGGNSDCAAHELLAIRFTSEPPTHALDSDDVCSRWLHAAQGWGPVTAPAPT